MELVDQDLLRSQAFIDGAWCDADDGRSFAVRDPATGASVFEVADLGPADALRAIDAATAAQAGFAALLPAERAGLLRRWHDLILANREDLAQICTAESGKPLAESRAEVGFAASFLDWFAAEAQRVYGDVIPPLVAGKRLVVVKRPVGVVAAITPWNFPLGMIARKAAPALAVGCTVVAKPAEQTPLSALALAVLAERAGIPPGVFNVVPALEGPPIGAVLCGDRRVRKLTFTGSTEVGRTLMRACADDLKRLSLELGGHAPFIVFDDADIDAAVEGAMVSKFRNTGQTCIGANRIFVQDAIYDQFAARFSERVRKLTVGAGSEADAEVGPLIDDAALAKVSEQVADAVAEGASVLTGGAVHARGGAFFAPTVLAEVTAGMKIAVEETFGPVAPLFRFTDEAEVVERANATEYGLAAYVYSRDVGRCWRVGDALEFGMVGINDALPSTAVAPFGGMKQSGFGREGSRYGVDDYLEIKLLSFGGI